MQDLFEDGISEFINYEKNLEGKKSRHQKKAEKIQRMKRDLQDPQQKKKRHEQRRAYQKAKLKKQFDGLSQDQVRQLLQAKALKKKQAKQRIMKALEHGQFIFIDIAYEKKMNQKQNKSLAIQIQLITKSIKHVENPPGVHLCNVNGVVKTQLQKMGYKYWTLKSHEQDILEVGKKLGKKLVYLSPDAQEQLTEVNQDTAYVIGGLVDRTVIRDASRDRARQMGIQARCLPIREMMINRSCLNLDHVVMIIWKFKDCGNWQEAFEFGAPKRWKRSQLPQGYVADIQDGGTEKQAKQVKQEKQEKQEQLEHKLQVPNQQETK